MADHPLRPATDRRLGEPLPHQLANQTRANPLAINLSPKRAHPVLAEISLSYSEPKGMFPRVTHPSATPALLRAFDLHVLSLPPAFVLSQDQTLMFKESIPKSQVHSTRSFHLSSILPDKAKTETLSRNVHSGLSSSWHIPQPPKGSDNVPTSPKRRPRFSFFLFTCQRTEENQSLKAHRQNPKLTARTRQQNTAGTTSPQRRRRWTCL
ncbi:conserved hypothetical protein [uncultured Pleomorphomonas sp.]|uniref:Uncharacterized protein n=1 Tax=uncultured Pleomorphomonas sp. TaxID=442121 RepID=A0A212LM72_9HYPH|nr:conserved hypothetical protein [uncultured Pleomorphomonas sp.]